MKACIRRYEPGSEYYFDEGCYINELSNSGDDPELSICVEYDDKARTLSVMDNGIGMSREELIDNLGTIAKSGTTEFLKQMSGDQLKDARLIGQFGVGFYSAFIVADKVTVETRRAGLDADEAVRWESDGEGEFTIESITRSQRGTSVTLHLKDDAGEFCDGSRVEHLIRRGVDRNYIEVRERLPGVRRGHGGGVLVRVGGATQDRRRPLQQVGGVGEVQHTGQRHWSRILRD